jgi:integration host factor subunit beta
MQNFKMKNKTYTKKDVAKKVADLRNEKVYIAEQWTDAIFTALREIIMEADPELRIEIRDFGVFEVKLTKSKPKARNPRTGETIYVPPRRKTHFKPSKLVKNFLQQPIDRNKYAEVPNPDTSNSEATDTSRRLTGGEEGNRE